MDVGIAEQVEPELNHGGADQQHGAPAGAYPEPYRREQAGKAEDAEVDEAGGAEGREGADGAGGDAEQAGGIGKAQQQRDDRDDADIAAGNFAFEIHGVSRASVAAS
ncbi:MAG: hypothetical protein EOP19_09040 [Hyphomicrobiales bacterium]|nr:MAG: hypothetical protein EOP19_09040 [Hyphomicrobiales bacterium]